METTTATTKHVGHYTFTIKAAAGSGWLWLVTYRGEHLASGTRSMWSVAEYTCRKTIADHAKEQ